MIGRFRVFFGFLAGILFVWMSHPAPRYFFIGGLAVSLAGLLLRGWAAGYLEKGRRLAQDGPYALFRHPLYAGSFLIAVGFLLAGAHPVYFAEGGPVYDVHGFILVFVAAALFLGVYPRRIREEEESLEKTFGDAWRVFVSRNTRFFPTFPPFRRPDADSFSWARYRKNREYQAALGVLTGVAVLLVKWRLLWGG